MTTKKLLVNASERQEVRLAILEDQLMEGIFIEWANRVSIVGNIYLGQVRDIRASLQVAFVDIGLERNAFLHSSEVRHRRFKSHRIQDMFRSGDYVAIQVIRDPLGDKGCQVTTALSVASRTFVLTPYSRDIVFSRHLNLSQRKIISNFLRNYKLPCGMIVRTNAGFASLADMGSDLDFILKEWERVRNLLNTEKPPKLIYMEPPFAVKILRDNFSGDLSEIVVDHKPTFELYREFITSQAPRFIDRLRFYSEKEPLFHRYKVEEQVESLFSRLVPLRSGGNLVIEDTEALISIDVNSDRATHYRNPELAAVKTNLEAAREVMRQIRLRDISGLIVVDFISMRSQRNRNVVYQEVMKEAIKDRRHIEILPLSKYDTMQITREKKEGGITYKVLRPCPACAGTGLVKDIGAIVNEIARYVKAIFANKNIERVDVVVNMETAKELEKAILHLGPEFVDRINISQNPYFPQGKVELTPFSAEGTKVIPGEQNGNGEIESDKSNKSDKSDKS